jgi:hypothetical protein
VTEKLHPRGDFALMKNKETQGLESSCEGHTTGFREKRLAYHLQVETQLPVVLYSKLSAVESDETLTCVEE